MVIGVQESKVTRGHRRRRRARPHQSPVTCDDDEQQRDPSHAITSITSAANKGVSELPERTDIRFTSVDAECSAWLYLPDGAAGPVPVVVMAHGLGAVKAMKLDEYAERFAAAGYGCLVFDYRFFGTSDGEPRQLLSVPRQLEDWEAALEYARNRPEFDADRVVAWGSSFGGGHAITMASRDHRLAAALAQCPFTDGIASALAINPVVSTKITALAVRDRIGARLGREPLLIPTAAAPGTSALMTAPDAAPGYLALVRDDAGGFVNLATARAVLDVLRYAPGRRTKEITCPIYFGICDGDSVAPDGASKKHAANAPRGEIVVYPFGHFDIYNGEYFERAVADQLAFLQVHVPVG